MPQSPASVTRVLRASLSRVNGSVMDELFAARERACGEHRIPGLHGSLLHSSGWFLLWLEGAAADVEAVLKRSAKHPCHTQPRVIHRSEGAPRLREALTLATTQWPETPVAFGKRIAALEHARPMLEPAEIWRRLSEPCNLPEGRTRRHIALVGADDTRCIDIVRKLADRFRSPMVYQRFASSDLQTRDVGAAYVDLPIDGEPTRVQVLSRRALGHGLVRDSLKGVEKLAVMLGPKPETAIELAQKVAGMYGNAVNAPEIDLVGQCPEVARSVADFLHRQQRAVPSRVLDIADPGLADALLEAKVA